LPRDFGALFDIDAPVQDSPTAPQQTTREADEQQTRPGVVAQLKRRRPVVLLVAAASVLILIFVGFSIPAWLSYYNGGAQSTTTAAPSPSSSASTPPSGQVAQNRTVSVPTTRDDLGRVDLIMTGIGPASAYFGSLRAISDTLGPSVDLGVTASNGSQCAETVVASGIPGQQGAIYAIGIGGWGAAEGAPSQDLQASGGTIHQQTIIPPTSVRAGYKLSASAQVVSDKANVSSGQFHLELVSIDAQGKANWILSGTLGTANVSCTVS
jgi:hypothetical protein